MLVYTDTNVFISAVQGLTTLPVFDSFKYAYSDTTIREVVNGKGSDACLDLMENIGAVFVGVDGEQLRVFDTRTPRLVADTLNAQDAASGNVEMFDGLMAVLNGGTEHAEALSTPGKIEEALRGYLKGVFPDEVIDAVVMHANEGMAEQIRIMCERNENILERKKSIGLDSNSYRDIPPENAIPAIWEMVKDSGLPGLLVGEVQTMEQFFGMAPTPNDPPRAYSIFDKVVRCCGIFDAIGYKSETKVRKTKGIQNSLRDKMHMANAAYCDVLLTDDGDMIDRARGIYGYLGLKIRILRDPRQIISL